MDANAPISLGGDFNTKAQAERVVSQEDLNSNPLRIVDGPNGRQIVVLSIPGVNDTVIGNPNAGSLAAVVSAEMVNFALGDNDLKPEAIEAIRTAKLASPEEASSRTSAATLKPQRTSEAFAAANVDPAHYYQVNNTRTSASVTGLGTASDQTSEVATALSSVRPSSPNYRALSPKMPGASSDTIDFLTPTQVAEGLSQSTGLNWRVVRGHPVAELSAEQSAHFMYVAKHPKLYKDIIENGSGALNFAFDDSTHIRLTNIPQRDQLADFQQNYAGVVRDVLDGKLPEAEGEYKRVARLPGSKPLGHSGPG
jgi:hypothetical protein